MKFQKKTHALIAAAERVINGLRPYWPLTLRQIYYQLVSQLIIENLLPEYRRLSRVLSDARIEGIIPWEAMEDRSRSVLQSGGWPSRQDFIVSELSGFLAGYRRDLLQSQKERFECWVEKDALASIVHRAAFDLCVPVVVAKGFSSTTYVNQCRERIEADPRPTRVFYFGDFDPSGWEMPDAMLRKLTGKLGVPPEMLAIQRCALLPEQIEQYSLPEDPEAMKPLDPRTGKFIELFGNDASPVELDALHPDTLQELVRQSIEGKLDLDALAAERKQESRDANQLGSISAQVQDFMARL